jgi:iron complex transport system ATP-binding protein
MIHFSKLIIGYKSALFTIENLSLQAGKLYALIGSNGSGKSTFLATINGETAPISGKISIKDKLFTAIPKQEKSRLIANVSSKFEGIEYLTVHDYVSLGRHPYTNFIGKLSPEDHVIIEQSIAKLNISELSLKATRYISDGERQMASIARALAQETPIILLDEPTAFLDYGNRIRLIRLLKQIADEENKCILFSCHELELCLEEQLEILLIDKSKKSLNLLSNNLSKKEILEIGF